jgi:hypothetical protein
MIYDTRVAGSRFDSLLLEHLRAARTSSPDIVYPAALPVKKDRYFVRRCSYVVPKIDVADEFSQLCLQHDLLPVDMTAELTDCDTQSEVMNLHRRTVATAVANPKEVYFFANNRDPRTVSRLQAYGQLKDQPCAPGLMLSAESTTPALVALRQDNFVLMQAAEDVGQLQRMTRDIMTPAYCKDDECPLCLTPYEDVARDVQLFSSCMRMGKHWLEWFLEGDDTFGPIGPYKGDAHLLELQRKFARLGASASVEEVSRAFAVRVGSLGYVKRGKFRCGHTVCGRCFHGEVYSNIDTCCSCRCSVVC